MDEQEMLDQIKALQAEYPGETIYVHFDESSRPIAVGRERLPLHTGHEMLIKDALRNMPQDIVIIGGSHLIDDRSACMEEFLPGIEESLRVLVEDSTRNPFVYTLGDAVANHMDRMVRVVEEDEPRAWVRANQAPRGPRKRR